MLAKTDVPFCIPLVKLGQLLWLFALLHWPHCSQQQKSSHISLNMLYTLCIKTDCQRGVKNGWIESISLSDKSYLCHNDRSVKISTMSSQCIQAPPLSFMLERVSALWASMCMNAQLYFEQPTPDYITHVVQTVLKALTDYSKVLQAHFGPLGETITGKTLPRVALRFTSAPSHFLPNRDS